MIGHDTMSGSFYNRLFFVVISAGMLPLTLPWPQILVKNYQCSLKSCRLFMQNTLKINDLAPICLIWASICSKYSIKNVNRLSSEHE